MCTRRLWCTPTERTCQMPVNMCSTKGPPTHCQSCIRYWRSIQQCCNIYYMYSFLGVVFIVTIVSRTLIRYMQIIHVICFLCLCSFFTYSDLLPLCLSHPNYVQIIVYPVEQKLGGIVYFRNLFYLWIIGLYYLHS